MSDASPGLLGRLFWFIWPLIVTTVAIALIWNHLQGSGLPGPLQMPVSPAGPQGTPLQLGVGNDSGTSNGLMISDPASPRVGLGPFTLSNQPQFDLDVLSDSVRFSPRNDEGSVQFHLPGNAELIIDNQQSIRLEDLLERIEKPITVSNDSDQAQTLEALKAMENQLQQLERAISEATQAARDADSKAVAARQQADAAVQRANQAAGRAEQGITAAAQASEVASQGQTMAQRAQSTGDQATSIANTARQSADQAKTAANTALKNSLALKKYVDLRNGEIQESLNAHYRSNRPGGKELIYRQLTAH